MRRVLPVVYLICLASAVCLAQRAPVRRTPVNPQKPPPVVPIKEAATQKNAAATRTYLNEKLSFSITFPEPWVIREDRFEDEMLNSGFDLRLKAPDTLTPVEKTKMNQSLQRVEILVTASRSVPNAADNAIIRVSTEDVRAELQIKDAVDYFDAVRQTYSTMKLPPDFKYSETGAEKLGQKAFAYLDISSKAGKKRMYATVRGGYAILFTISYVSDADLQTMRQVLATGNFSVK
jgi:hypothetical protein